MSFRDKFETLARAVIYQAGQLPQRPFASGPGCQLRALADTAQGLRVATPESQAFTPIAWTGGSSPRKPSALSMPEAAYRRALFRQQVRQWQTYWKDSPDFDTLRIYFRRACGDAHATFRNAENF